MGDHGAAGAVAEATDSRTENTDFDQEEHSQPEKKQVSVTAENLSSSRSAGTEVLSKSAENVVEVASTSPVGKDDTDQQ